MAAKKGATTLKGKIQDKQNVVVVAVGKTRKSVENKEVRHTREKSNEAFSQMKGSNQAAKRR